MASDVGENFKIWRVRAPPLQLSFFCRISPDASSQAASQSEMQPPDFQTWQHSFTQERTAHTTLGTSNSTTYSAGQSKYHDVSTQAARILYICCRLKSYGNRRLHGIVSVYYDVFRMWVSPMHPDRRRGSPNLR